jgi:hypothetical protein
MFRFYNTFVSGLRTQSPVNTTLAFAYRPALNPLPKRLALCGLPLFFYASHKVYCLGL